MKHESIIKTDSGQTNLIGFVVGDDPSLLAAVHTLVDY